MLQILIFFYLKMKKNIKVIFHLAAQPGVRLSENIVMIIYQGI